MTESAETHRALDFALRVGEMLLSNGAGVPDVTATMSSLCRHFGLHNVSVDATFVTLQIMHQNRPDEPQVVLTRLVTHREIDYDDLTKVDHLVRRILREDVSLDDSRFELARIASAGHRTPRWAITASWGVTGGGIAVLLGGNWLVALIAFLAAVGIEILQRKLSRRRIPFFYQQAAGGFFATLFAVAAAAIHAPVNPSLVVSTSIIMLLAGLGFIGAIQDALSGFYITANARILEVMLATAGVIVGVSGGLTVGEIFGIEIHFEPGASAWSQVPIMVLGAAVAAAGFAFSAFSPMRALLPIGAVGALAATGYLAVTQQGIDRTWAAAVASIIVGLVSYTIAGWCKVPPLVIVVSAIVPLLPGLSLYRALAMLSEGNTSGMLWLVTAAGVAIALASGVILGEYIVQPLQRGAQRLEGRLWGPRLVGPLRYRRSRRNRNPRRE